jgi:hypothetical protein
MVTRDWLNAVQEELSAIALAAGGSLSKTDRSQALKALLRITGGNVSSVTGTGSLTADQAGVVSVSASGGNVTLTLPAANGAGGAPMPFTFIRTDTSANSLTIQRAGSDTIEGATSIPIPLSGRLTLRSDGISAWRVVSEANMGRVLAASGWQRLPSGLILQWGSVGWGAAALPDFGGSWSGSAPTLNVAITFPVTFPNACWMVTGNGSDATGGNDGLESAVTFGSVTTSGATARAIRLSGSNGGIDVGSIRYLALGN